MAKRRVKLMPVELFLGARENEIYVQVGPRCICDRAGHGRI